MLTEAQIQARRFGIGGSDMPIILGLSTYKTPFTLYLEKIGTLECKQEMTDAQYWGHKHEPVIRDEFAKRHNLTIETPDTITHPTLKFMLANLDGFIPELNAVLEIKTCSEWRAKDWGDIGTDSIPLSYLIQVAHYCIVTNSSCAYIAALIGLSDYREFKYERDPVLENHIIEVAAKFWACVQNKTPPPPVNQYDLRLMFPKHHPDKIKKIDRPLHQKIASFTDTRSKIKQLNELEDKYKFDIMQFMGDAECLVDDEGEPIISWKANKKGSRMFLVKGV